MLNKDITKICQFLVLIDKKIQRLSERNKYLFLWLIGFISFSTLIIWAKCGNLDFASGTYMGIRKKTLMRALEQVFNGELMSFTRADHNITYYLYLAYLGKLLNIKDPTLVFFCVQLLAYGSILLCIPALSYYLTDSLLIGVLSPALVRITLQPVLFDWKNDTYWSFAWAVILGVLLLAALWKRSKTDIVTIAINFLICLVISTGNVVRMNASLAIAILYFGVLVKKVFVRGGWKELCKYIIKNCWHTCYDYIVL